MIQPLRIEQYSYEDKHRGITQFNIEGKLNKDTVVYLSLSLSHTHTHTPCTVYTPVKRSKQNLQMHWTYNHRFSLIATIAGKI